MQKGSAVNRLPILVEVARTCLEPGARGLPVYLVVYLVVYLMVYMMAYLAAVLPKRLRKRSTRPPMLSTDFCVPV